MLYYVGGQGSGPLVKGANRKRDVRENSQWQPDAGYHAQLGEGELI